MKDEVAKQMQDTLNWAVLGTGVIANEMAQALQKMGKSLYAVGNRTHEKAVAFAEKYGVSKVYDAIVQYRHMKNIGVVAVFDRMKFEEPTDNMFAFNSPLGACPTCEGFVCHVLGFLQDIAGFFVGFP